MAFDQAAHLGRDVLLLDDVAVGYETTLLHDLNLVIQAGERVVLTGPNGTGKSTLVKTIMGELRPRSGTIRLGHRLNWAT
ncbi:MAG: ATP-binding cassette domain-containing protein [Chloroflexi bacterium]|nr:ATP-binding cassette domain-containing protein [Chloroflexota bacterium]